jgi:hypothetical protein
MKYTPETIAIIIDSLTKGNGRVVSCAKAHIDYQTFLNWMADPRKVEFVEAVKKAEIAGYNFDEEQYKGVIKKAAGAGTWQAAAWMLERRHGYTARINNEMTGTLKHEVTTKDIIAKAFPEPEPEPDDEAQPESDTSNQ